MVPERSRKKDHLSQHFKEGNLPNINLMDKQHSFQPPHTDISMKVGLLCSQVVMTGSPQAPTVAMKDRILLGWLQAQNLHWVAIWFH